MFWFLCLLFVGLCVFIRFAPSDPAKWHIDPLSAADPGEAGVLLLPGQGAPVGNLSDLDDIALQTPRTTQLAGSLQEGMITYVTRSKGFGFPDYTTVRAIPKGDGTSDLGIFARLRFGRSDLGVNAARIDGWVKALEALDQAR